MGRVRDMLWDWKYKKKITESQYEKLRKLGDEYEREHEKDIVKGFPTFEERGIRQHFEIVMKVFGVYNIIFECSVGTQCVDIVEVRCKELDIEDTYYDYEYCCGTWEKVWRNIHYEMKRIEEREKGKFETMIENGLKLEAKNE
jgi:hypothetical protein